VSCRVDKNDHCKPPTIDQVGWQWRHGQHIWRQTIGSSNQHAPASRARFAFRSTGYQVCQFGGLKGAPRIAPTAPNEQAVLELHDCLSGPAHLGDQPAVVDNNYPRAELIER
jgi:hypothetical protein